MHTAAPIIEAVRNGRTVEVGIGDTVVSRPRSIAGLTRAIDTAREMQGWASHYGESAYARHADTTIPAGDVAHALAEAPAHGGARQGAGRLPRSLNIRPGDTFAAVGRAELVTVVSVERGGFAVEFEGGERIAFVARSRAASE